jgi:hypothetical protein
MLRHREIWAAAAVIAVVTALYAALSAHSGTPAPSSLIGHSIGITGFVMMIMTEVLYSMRKRATGNPRGSMRAWLQLHIFTGITGPYLVLLHTAFTFQGLAGVLTLMMAIVVLSGFIGRYIYTAVPRTNDGAVIEADELAAMLAEARAADEHGSAADHRRLRDLERQMGAMRWARRALAAWHVAHIPLGMAMFATALAHMAAVLYFAASLR